MRLSTVEVLGLYMILKYIFIQYNGAVGIRYYAAFKATGNWYNNIYKYIYFALLLYIRNLYFNIIVIPVYLFLRGLKI